MNVAPNLERLQAAVQDYVLHGDGAHERLGIYHLAYRARLADVLRDTFGHTAAFLGEAFEAHAAAYVESHASGHASLRGYGRAFPEWLAQEAPERPEAAELAALDRALRDAFDCADSPAMTLADLAAVDPGAWGSTVLKLTRSYGRLRFEHNTLALWQALDDEAPPPPVTRLGRPLDVLVWRRGLQPHFRSLPGFEAAALDDLQAGRDFSATCERLAGSFPGADVASEAGRLLRRWVEEEVLSSISGP